MKKLPTETVQIDPLALQVWEDVVYSMDAYTCDSAVSKFFPPEPLATHCRAVASAFAQIHYMPIPSKEEISRSRLFALLLLAMNCGVQTYLKERAIFTNAAPYRVETDPKLIREAKSRVTQLIEDGVEVFAPFDQVMALFLAQLTPSKQRVKHASRNRVFNEALFDKFLPLSLVWGYLFAKELIKTESL